MIEELRVGLYAHPMRTRYPVSIKRIQTGDRRATALSRSPAAGQESHFPAL